MTPRDDDRAPRFKYKPRDHSAVQKRASQQGGMYDSAYKDEFKVWSPKEGSHVVRILPPTFEGADHFGLDVWVRSGIGPDNQTYIALDKMKNQPDPIAEAVAELTRQGKADEEWVKSLKPYRRVLVWIIVRGQEKEGPQLWPMPWTVDRDINNLMIDKRTGEILNIDDPEEGYDVEFSRQGTRTNTKYVGVAISRRSSPLADDPKDADAWLSYIQEYPLPETLNYYDYDYIKKVFDAAPHEKKESSEEKPPRTRSERREPDEPAPSRRRVEDDSDDDLPPPKKAAAKIDDDGADLDSPPPKRRAAPPPDEDDAPPPKRRAAPPPDEDDEPAPKRRRDEDDDEAPAPKRRRDEDDDEPAPRKRRRDEDEDEPAPRKRRRDEDEDEAF